jgi:hypothetical protein
MERQISNGGETGQLRLNRQDYIIIFLLWKAEGSWPLGRPDRTWDDNIKMDLIEIRQEDVNCIH